MTNWETLTYKDQAYVKITPSERARSREEELENLAVYYVASGDSLLLTPNETLLKRSIDRQLAREEAKKKGEKSPEVEHPWLGENVSLAVQGKLVQLVAGMTQSRRPSPMQIESWNNLPILKEWKRRYPKEDPVELGVEILARRIGLSRRRQICLERKMADHGIDRLRPPRRAERQARHCSRSTRSSSAEILGLLLKNKD